MAGEDTVEVETETYDFGQILAVLQEMQENTVEDGATVDVILAPHDEPGHAKFEVEADEGASTPEFLLDLRDSINEALENGDYEGNSPSPELTTSFLEPSLEKMWPEFDRENR